MNDNVSNGVKPKYGTCQELRPLDGVSTSDFEMPAGACDTHMHVFGSEDTYPGVKDRQYLRPPGSLAEYSALAEKLGISRMVIVQPSFYGTDNRCLLDAMAESDLDCRATVFLDPATPPQELAVMHERGVRGLRLDLFKALRDGTVDDDIEAYVRKSAAKVADLGWHIELYAPGTAIRLLTPVLADLPVPVSINHLGFFELADESGNESAALLIDALSSGRVWIKLTGSYRLDHDQASLFPAVDDLARKMIAAAPDRMLWGTDWPHLPTCGRDTGAVVGRLADWCPDAETRNRILVDNAARFYDFQVIA